MNVQKPKCSVKECKNDGFVKFYGRFICGECVMDFYNKRHINFWDDIGEKK
jgi:hypothetical protein|tara:strand:+ start:681 stop:833 length:153 start_codon:yes stop_codon:yes gene_type:complete